jgi:hypothetical protein
MPLAGLGYRTRYLLSMKIPSLPILLATVLLLGSCAPATAGSPPEAAEVAATAGEAFAAALAAYEAGAGELDAVYRWSVRWLEAQAATPDAAAAHLARMQALETQVEGRYQQGMASDMDRKAARFYRSHAARQVLAR